MADRKGKIDARRERILERLRQDGRVSVGQLSTALDATTVTIRSDLSALEQEGRLLRVQGGAVLPREQAGQPGAIENHAGKQRIAQAVAALVHDGDTLFINSGTTSVCVAAALKTRKNLNIVTNALAVATELSEVSGFRVLLLGGEVNARFGFTYGGDAQEQLGRYQADWAVLSVDGISAKGGITTYHAQEAILDRMMMDGAGRTLIAADRTKIGKTGFTRVQACAPGLRLVTDGAEPEALEELRACGVECEG